MINKDYSYTDNNNPHAERSRSMLKKYPEIRKLMKPDSATAFWITLIIILQVGIAAYFGLNEIHWGWMVLTAYTIGAVANHNMFVFVHESCHDAIFKSRFWSKMWGIFANIPQAVPSAMSFRTYHLLHHAHMSEYDFDADLAFHKEAKLVGNSKIMKTLWFVFFFVVEIIRPARIKKGRVFDRWIALNFLIIIATNLIIWNLFGPTAMLYLALSTLFSVGLHPVGARWIQEHYVYKEGQETYSYYGIMNNISFNIGYHNEHHDFYKIPWSGLRKLKAIAPEYYDNLYSHKSWTLLLLDFIFNPKRDLYNRLVRNSDRYANKKISAEVNFQENIEFSEQALEGI